MNVAAVYETLRRHRRACYCYILRDAAGTPFYVGVGQDRRLFHHQWQVERKTRGASFTEEHKRKIADAHRGKPKAMNVGGRNSAAKSVEINGVRYSCMKEAMLALGLKYYDQLRRLMAVELQSS